MMSARAKPWRVSAAPEGKDADHHDYNQRVNRRRFALDLRNVETE